jgi:hypothetical protein
MSWAFLHFILQDSGKRGHFIHPIAASVWQLPAAEEYPFGRKIAADIQAVGVIRAGVVILQPGTLK